MINKKKILLRFLYGILVVVIILLLTPFILYRLSFSSPLIKTAELQFQVFDIGQQDIVRHYFEWKLGNRRVFLRDKGWIYVNESHYKKCWLIPPFELKKRQQTVEIKFETSSLVFGGYSLARIVDVKLIEGKPLITK